MKKKLLILIAHYNYPDGLEASLRSIEEDFQVDILVVDDGSNEALDEERFRNIFKSGDIYFDHLPTNQGVGVAANRALELAQGMNYELLGRMDCGDLCYKGKYKKQLQYLSENLDVKLLGTWARVVDEKGKFLHMLKFPTDYEEIKKKMYLNSMFLNPSVVFYAEIIHTVGNYPYKYRRASQDYAFFFNVIKHFKAENLPEVLMDYVVESHSISTTKRKLQVKNRLLVIQENFYLGVYPIIGWLRSAVLYFFPRSATTFLKKKFRK